MSTSITDRLAVAKAHAKIDYAESHGGSLAGFEAGWQKIEPDVIVGLHAQDKEQAEADAAQAEKDRMPTTAREKSDYIDKYGDQAYRELVTRNRKAAAAR